MNSSALKTTLRIAVASGILLLANGMAMADSDVTLSVMPTSTTLPDGQTVPMWGYACGTVSTGATCTQANGAPQTAGWQPPLITVPSDQPLNITLVNQLHFTTAGTPNDVPTSLVIVGQLGGGLGSEPARMEPIAHAPQGTTWPGTPGDVDATACQAGGDPGAAATFCPPKQVQRVRSFATEVAAGSSSTLTWSDLRPGTYLIQSGTQPSIQGRWVCTAYSSSPMRLPPIPVSRSTKMPCCCSARSIRCRTSPSTWRCAPTDSATRTCGAHSRVSAAILPCTPAIRRPSITARSTI